MRNSNILSRPCRSAGFTLPAILVVVGALLILAVGVLLMASIERNTARSFVDRQRAELAARAGLEDVKGILNLEAANDDFLIVQSKLANPIVDGHQPAPHLFIARGALEGGNVSYRYLPLFSRPDNSVALPKSTDLVPPELKPSSGQSLIPTNPNDPVAPEVPHAKFDTLPYQDKIQTAWVPVKDSSNRMVGRYAYWVEDLQSKVEARTAGNTKDAGSHKRFGWKAGDTSKFAKFPAPGLNPEESKPGPDGRDAEPPLDQMALYLLDPDSGAKDGSTLGKTIIEGRKMLVSPDSVLAAAKIEPPLVRLESEETGEPDGKIGALSDKKARALEMNLTAAVQPYDEQPLVPFAAFIDAAAVGEPKLNLNSMLAKPSEEAVTEMADWIEKALPKFEERKGGFPDNYLKTLAANAIDYADLDNDGTISPGNTAGPDAYRGLDAYPLMSEVILHIKYLGASVQKGRRVLLWQFILSVELWNHTNQEVSGSARVSYENGMTPPAIGVGVAGSRFDDPELMDDTDQVRSSPQVTRIGNYYWSAPINVVLKPNQYKFYRAATINYTMDVGSSSQTLQSNFNIFEDLGSSGISMMWNEREVDRSDKLVRGNSSPTNPELEYVTNTQKQSGKANIPGHSYGPYNNKTPPDYRNNMGDSRQALYLRGPAYPLSDNSYPGNVSPNRRNIRNVSIYKNGAGQNAVYGRVLPSEWPDGGHDAPVSGLTGPNAYPSPVNYEPWDLTKFPDYISPHEGDAPTLISNRGRFYSATELGRIFDPVMYLPKYDNDSDTTAIRTGNMPPSRGVWPSVEKDSAIDIYYGGGNTLRIGRPEHPQFDLPAKHAPRDMPGTHAARLLDLFHAGKSRSETPADREGPVVRIEGHINLNTATEDAIRAMAGGMLVADPRLVKRTSDTHSGTTFAPPVSPLEVSTPSLSKEADLVAQSIIRGRPYNSPSEIASVLTPDEKVLLGNRELLPDGKRIQWSDAAAEELFARIYESSTVRSRNFRVWVVGQSVAPTALTNANPEVMSEARKVFTVFADPGVRNSDGTLDTAKFRTRILHENDF